MPSRSTRVRDWVSANTTLLNLISLSVLGLLVVSYILQVNTTISKGYQIRDLETQVHELTLMNQQLELETRKSQSLQHVATSVKMLGFVEAQSPEYISASAPAYALAE